MVIYEVNAAVDEDVAPAYEAWLHGHIRQMLAFDGFVHASVFTSDSGAPGRRHFTVHYHVSDRTHLDDYLRRHAAAMRADGINRFGDRFATDRRILSEIAAFK